MKRININRFFNFSPHEVRFSVTHYKLHHPKKSYASCCAANDYKFHIHLSKQPLCMTISQEYLLVVYVARWRGGSCRRSVLAIKGHHQYCYWNTPFRMCRREGKLPQSPHAYNRFLESSLTTMLSGEDKARAERNYNMD